MSKVHSCAFSALIDQLLHGQVRRVLHESLPCKVLFSQYGLGVLIAEPACQVGLMDSELQRTGHLMSDRSTKTMHRPRSSKLMVRNSRGRADPAQVAPLPVPIYTARDSALTHQQVNSAPVFPQVICRRVSRDGEQVAES